MKYVVSVMMCIMVAGCDSGPVKEGKKAVFYEGPTISVAPQARVPGRLPEKAIEDTVPATEYIEGTGVFYQTAPGTRIQWSENLEAVSLTFKNTDIRTIVKAVLSDTLGLSYVIDPRVQGTATLETVGAIHREILQETLETLLRIKGYALVETLEGFHILPLAEAPSRVGAIRRGLPGSINLPGFGVRIVTLKHTLPSEMQQLLEPFAPTGGILRADNSRNFLILGGTSQELTSMMHGIETFDVDWMAGMSFAVYSLKYTDPGQIVAELRSIFEGEGMPGRGRVRYIPIPRLNKLLAVAPDRDMLQSIDTWIRKLDLGNGASGRRIYVYPVRNGRASDIADTLNMILTTQGYYGTGEQNGDRNPAGMPGLTQSSRERGASLRLPANMQNMNSVSRGADGTIGDTGLRIVPDEENNSIIMLATPSEFGLVETALKHIDVPPKQVLVEVTLVDVTLTDELRYGLQWQFEFGDNSVSLGKSATPTAEFPGFSWAHTSGTNARAVLNALESLTDVKVISSPKLLVLNNHPATLQVGDEVPVPRASAVSINDSNAPIVNSIDYRTTGVILTVIPRINEGGLIMLDIEQEVSNVAQTVSSGIDAPTIQQRRLTSSVAAQSGSTVALGGLIRSTYSKGRSGVPLLKDIPLLGAVFRNSEVTERRSELVVLLTPRIIRDANEQSEVMDYLRQTFHSLIHAEAKEQAGVDEQQLMVDPGGEALGVGPHEGK